MAYDGNYTSDLDATKPLGTESPVVADDALREIKRAMKNDIPPLQSDVSTLKNTTVPGIQSSLTNTQNVTIPALQQADQTLQYNIDSIFNQTVLVGNNSSYHTFVSAYRSAGVSIAGGTPDKQVVFDYELADFRNEYNPSTGVFTASSLGLYLVQYSLKMTVGINQYGVANVKYNDALLIESSAATSAATTVTTVFIGLIAKLNPGDTLKFYARYPVAGWITEDGTRLYIARLH